MRGTVPLDLPGLTAALSGLLRCPEKLDDYRRHASGHLSPHRRKTVAQAYSNVMQAAMREEHPACAPSARAIPAWKGER